ncbi:hypothetical protein [uncultured Psychroserpens sp.]|uniref:tetratricopeptide repeat protein n=1 Tax=uncultured Psychroserpens sp. TaxID=255436 RepID=UPI002633A3A1|nr:hypothetical protein [uncultured Psychroserpens sp.]
MKINITPTKLSRYPKTGILIRSNQPYEWIHELQNLGVTLENAKAYAIPSHKANTLYGCFVILNSLKNNLHVSNVTVFQSVNNHIYIPDFSKITPILSEQECTKLFKFPHIYHPDFGWVELQETINWSEIIQLRPPVLLNITVPQDAVQIQNDILSFQLVSKSDEAITKDLDLKLETPKKDKLNTLDKIKLNVLKRLFTSSKTSNGNFSVERKGFMKWLDNLSGSGSKSKSRRSSKWEKNLEKLLYRNQKEADKLLHMLKLNPKSALQFAVPLDLIGSSRDSGHNPINIFSKNTDGDSAFSNIVIRILTLFTLFAIVYLVYLLFSGIFSGNLIPFLSVLIKTIGIIVAVVILIVIFERLFGGNRGSGGSGTVDADRLNALREQYEKLAKEAIAEKDYKKAASIYIKLLKDYYAAADTLEDGNYFQESALIHLKYNKDKVKAANVYEKGKIYDKAIRLYKELNAHEKVGDIYKAIHNTNEANTYYQMVIEDYLEHDQYVKASLIYKYKIEDAPKAQTILLKGWREDKDAYNCLTNYFSNFPNTDILKKGIEFIYKKETSPKNLTLFLKALKVEHQKHESIQDFTQTIAYEIVANNLKDNPGITYELKSFNKENHLIQNDATRFVKRKKYKK